MENANNKPMYGQLALNRCSLCLKWATRALIGLAVVLLALGTRSYFQQQEQTRVTEQICALNDELCAIGQTDDCIRALGDGRSADVRQKLNLALLDRIKSLDTALVSADENTRAWAKGIIALIESDKSRHPAYYAIPGAARPALPTDVKPAPLKPAGKIKE